jgi:hypothetical protein
MKKFAVGGPATLFESMGFSYPPSIANRMKNMGNMMDKRPEVFTGKTLFHLPQTVIERARRLAFVRAVFADNGVGPPHAVGGHELKEKSRAKNSLK